MRGIDISSVQRNIDLARVRFDFCIVKATQGGTYLNPSFADHIEAVLASGKCAGAYHYVGGRGCMAEARKFYKAVKPYLGRITLWIDWESHQNARYGDLEYLGNLIDEVKRLCKQPVGVYASYASFPFKLCAAKRCMTWVAQYATMDMVKGYQAHPWNEGKYNCDIRQYTGNGRLSGYARALDLNKCYASKKTWASWCVNEKGMVKPVVTVRPADKPSSKPSKGRYVVTTPSGLRIRRKPSTAATVAGVLNKGESVFITQVKRAGDHWWGGYTGYSGKACWIALSVVGGKSYAKRV